jgi:hypothetical protein
VQKPAFDSIVKRHVDVIGSVADPRFAFYTVELRPVGREAWDTLYVSSALPASGDTLYRWDTKAHPDGVWELRVGSTDSLGLNGYVSVKVVVDNLGAQCERHRAGEDRPRAGRAHLHDRRPGRARRAAERLSRPTRSSSSIPWHSPRCRSECRPARCGGPSFVIHASDMSLDKPATLTFRLADVAPTGAGRVLPRADRRSATPRSCRSAAAARRTA